MHRRAEGGRGVVHRRAEGERGLGHRRAEALTYRHGAMNTAVVRAGTVNVPVCHWNLDVRTTGSLESICTGCRISG